MTAAARSGAVKEGYEGEMPEAPVHLGKEWELGLVSVSEVLPTAEPSEFLKLVELGEIAASGWSLRMLPARACTRYSTERRSSEL